MPSKGITLESISKVVRVIVKEEIQPIRDEMKEFKNEVLNREDNIIHELKTIREEQIAGAGRDDQQDKEIKSKGQVKNLVTALLIALLSKSVKLSP